MAIVIVAKVDLNALTGVARYLKRMRRALDAEGVPTVVRPLDPWKHGQTPADERRDLLILDNQDLRFIPDRFACIGVQHGCAAENVLRDAVTDHKPMAAQQKQVARRPRTFWVAVSEWTSWRCEVNYGNKAERIVPGSVDCEGFKPSERQRRRDAAKPVVMYLCSHPKKGARIIGRIRNALGGDFEFRDFKGTRGGKEPEAMQGADMWLCLASSEGGPLVVMEAAATDLVVVATNTGVMWDVAPDRAGEAKRIYDTDRTGLCVFPWQHRGNADAVGEYLRTAWHFRTVLHPRAYAQREWSIKRSGERWAEAIQAAKAKLGVAE